MWGEGGICKDVRRIASWKWRKGEGLFVIDLFSYRKYYGGRESHVNLELKLITTGISPSERLPTPHIHPPPLRLRYGY